jgi:two-component system, chemotaxis family, response regulator Rcp1
MDGREVLAEIKRDPALRCIPVCVLSTSKAELDRAECYNLHANCYLRKPLDFEEFVSLLRALESFWFVHVQPPPQIRGTG